MTRSSWWADIDSGNVFLPVDSGDFFLCLTQRARGVRTTLLNRLSSECLGLQTCSNHLGGRRAPDAGSPGGAPGLLCPVRGGAPHPSQGRCVLKASLSRLPWSGSPPQDPLCLAALSSPRPLLRTRSRLVAPLPRVHLNLVSFGPCVIPASFTT